MRILVVSPFPPLRDGVGRYAAQEVTALRDEGHEVEVLAPVPCAAHYVEDFKRGTGLLRMRTYARRFDRVILHYQPAHMHRTGSGLSRVVSNVWMMLAFRTIRNMTIVCHEVEYPPPSWSRRRPETITQRMAWKRARDVAFHTHHEVDEMKARLGITPKHVTMRDHGLYFRRAVEETRSVARYRLRLPEDQRLLLCIGFIQSHKGFDRAIRAFRRVPGPGRLVVVGSVREETDEHRAYSELLRELALGDPRIEIREQVLSDEEFDRWISASDVVVLPYREIWSSGVLERAKVLGRPVIATAVGGMTEQMRPADTLVSNDDELALAMARALGVEVATMPKAMSVEDAIESVDTETRHRRRPEWGGGADRTLHLLDRARGVQPVILPSRRRGIGVLLDRAKRVMFRGLGWLVTPLLQQINEFQRLTYDALKAVLAEVRGADPSTYTLFDYREFETYFRGNSELVKENQRAYVDLFAGRSPVVDVGCGRGEFLELLRESGISAKGVDLSLGMIELCRRKGFEVEHGDGVAYLENLWPASIGGVMASQVIEHLSPRLLVRFLAAARRALRPDGVLVCETINPQSLYALANYYVMDLTHANPIHPSTLTFLAEHNGFADVEIRYLSPARIQGEAASMEDVPDWARKFVEETRGELRSLDEVVFGPLDYALIARVP